MTSSPLATDGRRPKQRRRLLSSSEVQELTAQRRTDLLADARSHGPYNWTNADVRNALLWFRRQQPTSSSSATNANGGPEDSSLGIATADGGAFGLLRSLLRNPGIAEARPAKPRRRPRPEGADGGEGSNYYEDEYPSGRRPSRQPKRSEPPLREVLVGYVSADRTDASAPSSVKEAGRRRSRRPLDVMRSDLGDIAAARSETHQLYKACAVASKELGGGGSKRADCRHVGEDAKVAKLCSRNLSGLARNDLRLAVLDESDGYFQLPGTAVAIAYASEFYDCLADLEGGTDNLQKAVSLDDDEGGDTPASTSRLTDASQQLLDKLGMLACSNMRIMEVYGLLLLEPVRRVGSSSRQSRSDGPTVRDSKSGVIVSPSDIDNACSSRLCTELCQKFLTLHSSDDNKGRSTRPIAASSWADLSSPLLCAISHAYFPLALEYVRYLLQRSIDIHLDMPRAVAERVMSSMSLSRVMGSTVGNNDVNMAEDLTRHRLLALLGTSDRLSCLVKNELNRSEEIDLDLEGNGDDERTEKFQMKRKEALYAVRSTCREALALD